VNQNQIGDELDPLSQIDESLDTAREEEKTGQVFQVSVSFWFLLTKLNVVVLQHQQTKYDESA
jgi:hypothetical protein